MNWALLHKGVDRGLLCSCSSFDNFARVNIFLKFRCVIIFPAPFPIVSLVRTVKREFERKKEFTLLREMRRDDAVMLLHWLQEVFYFSLC